jgi:predicted dehydrogenase
VSAPRVLAIAAGAHIFGAAHVPAIDAVGAEIVGVTDADTARAAALAEPRGWPVLASLDELLAVPADLAVIAAPHPLHAELAIRCLEAGLHVLVEKPLAARPSEARRMVEAAERTGRVLAVFLQHRLRTEVQEAKRLIDAGHLGTLHRACVVSTYPKRSAYYRAAPWRGTWKGEGGGVLLNQGQHDLDTLVHLVGMPTSVVARSSTSMQPIETEDTVEALLAWEGGATGSVHVSSVSSDPPNRIELVGSGGSLRITPGLLEVTRYPEDFATFVSTDGGPFDAFERGEVTSVTGGGGSHEDVYRDLLSALAEGRAPVAPASDALPALELTAAIILSSHRRAWIDLPLDAAEYDSMVEEAISTATAAGEPAAEKGEPQ